MAIVPCALQTITYFVKEIVMLNAWNVPKDFAQAIL